MCRFASTICVISFSSVAVAVVFMMSSSLHFIFSHGRCTSVSASLTLLVILITDITGDTENDDEE